MRKKEMETDVFKGFIQVPHAINNVLLVLDLTSRQRRALELIIRLTFGCHKKWAKLSLADLQTVNILPSHARETIESLLLKKLINQNGRTKEYQLNEKHLLTDVTKMVSFSLQRLSKLVGKQLGGGYQNGNEEVTESETQGLPKKEDDAYQNSNNDPLPDEEVLASPQHDFASLKDRLNKIKERDKDKYESKIKKSHNNQHPKYFLPTTQAEEAALEVFNELESDHPEAFFHYLFAAQDGLTVNDFHEITSEVKTSKVKNKGKAFRAKVKDYLEARHEK